jgi:hypothetical protein
MIAVALIETAFFWFGALCWVLVLAPLFQIFAGLEHRIVLAVSIADLFIHSFFD